MDAADSRAALAVLVARSGVGYAALSRLIGRNAAYLQQFVTRGSPRRLAEADRRVLASFFGVSEATLGADPASTAGGIAIPRLDVAASAGAGTLVEAEPQLGALELDPHLIARLGARPENLSLIRAVGRSMEPLIADGDELLVDAGDRRIRRQPAIFVIRLDGALAVKRVARCAAGYRVISDNPAFATIEVTALDLVGRVVWLSRSLR